MDAPGTPVSPLVVKTFPDRDPERVFREPLTGTGDSLRQAYLVLAVVVDARNCSFDPPSPGMPGTVVPQFHASWRLAFMRSGHYRRDFTRRRRGTAGGAERCR